jgi:hypothetical protein
MAHVKLVFVVGIHPHSFVIAGLVPAIAIRRAGTSPAMTN